MPFGIERDARRRSCQSRAGGKPETFFNSHVVQFRCMLRYQQRWIGRTLCESRCASQQNCQCDGGYFHRFLLGLVCRKFTREIYSPHTKKGVLMEPVNRREFFAMAAAVPPLLQASQIKPGKMFVCMKPVPPASISSRRWRVTRRLEFERWNRIS